MKDSTNLLDFDMSKLSTLKDSGAADMTIKCRV